MTSSASCFSSTADSARAVPDDVGAGEAVVGQQDGAVGAERQRLGQRPLRALRPHAHGDDLVDLLAALADADGLLEAMHVERIQLAVT